MILGVCKKGAKKSVSGTPNGFPPWGLDTQRHLQRPSIKPTKIYEGQRRFSYISFSKNFLSIN
jgi:hypothetical protein